MIAVAASAISHGLLAFTYVNPYLSIILLGVAYSILASALWSLPALLVPDHQLGTAFGIMQVLYSNVDLVRCVAAALPSVQQGYPRHPISVFTCYPLLNAN